MRLLALWPVPLALLVTMAPQARASDTFSSSRSPALVEKAHEVRISLHGDYAELKVTRTLHNGGERPDQAIFHINPGVGAVATGLRTRAVIDGKPIWFSGELMEAEAAAAKYRELTGIGGYYPKDPALLSWRSQSDLALQVFPCMPKEDKLVEYTLLMPTRYEDGRYHLSLQPMGTGTIDTVATIQADAGTFVVDDEEAHGTLVLDETRVISQTLDPVGPVSGDLASVPFGGDRSLLGYHFDVAPRLGAVPDKARVVVLIDASHSFGSERIDASRAAASSYLAHFKGSDVEASVIAFSREAVDLTSGFVSVEAARKKLGTAVAPKNGSELGLALERAGTLLSTAPAGAVRRIVVFTDLETRESLDPDRVRASVPGGALLHIAAVSHTSSTTLARDDDDAWAKVARATGGVLWNTSALASSDATSERVRRSVFEELARPIRIDRLKISGGGLETPDTSSTLDEGQRFEDHRVADRYVSFVSLSGEVWSKRIEKTLEPDQAYGKRRAALVFGTPLADELTDKEMIVLAMYGRAVSPVTSYLAIEPGVRPSTEGLEPIETGGTGLGASGFGLMGTGEGGGGASDQTDYKGLLSDLAEPGMKRCNIDTKATLTAESTVDEIVRVEVTVQDDDAKKSKASCLAEHLWAAHLPAQFKMAEHRTTKVTL